MQLSEMQKVLHVVFAQWPHVPVSEELVRLWNDCFKEYPLNSFYAAVRAVLLTKADNFPPTITEVQALLDRSKDENSALDDGELWGLVIAAVGTFGTYREKEVLEYFENKYPRVAFAIKAMGWRNICGSSVDDHPSLRAHFWRIIKAANERTAYQRALGKPERNALKIGHAEKVGDILKRLSNES